MSQQVTQTAIATLTRALRFNDVYIRVIDGTLTVVQEDYSVEPIDYLEKLVDQIQLNDEELNELSINVVAN